jgi:septal ring factor EnvC (AmiA/AmiB activator)
MSIRQAGETVTMAAETPDINDLATRLQRLEQFQHSTAYAQMLRIEQVQAQVAAPAAALGILDFRIQQVQTELTGFRAEVHTELETIKTDVAELKTDVAGLKTGVTGLKTDVAGLKTDVAGLKTGVAGLKTGVTELKTDVAGLKTGVTAVKTAQTAHGELLQKILDRLPSK